jgi:hypothetical protein
VIHIQTHRVMGGIYEVRRCYGLICYDIHTKFHKDLFRNSEDDGVVYTDTQRGDLISLLLFLGYFPYFEIMIVGLGHLHTVCVSIPLIRFWMAEPIFLKFDAHIMAPEPISMAYFITLSHKSVCLYMYPPLVARQRLSRNVTATKNTHATIAAF